MAEGVETKKPIRLVDRKFETILLIRNRDLDELKTPDYDRKINSEESDSYIEEIQDILMESYRPNSDNVNTRLCNDLNLSYTASGGVFDSDFTILVKAELRKGGDWVERIVGQLSVNKESEIVWEVNVLCGYPGIKGVGSYLIDTLETMCRLNGIEKLILESVIPAREFYEKMGFTATYEWEDGVNMEKMV